MANHITGYKKLQELLDHFSDQFRNKLFDGFEDIRSDYERSFPGRNLNMCDIYDVSLDIHTNPINMVYMIEYPESRSGDYKDCIIPSHSNGLAYLHFVCNSVRRPGGPEEVQKYILDCVEFLTRVISYDIILLGPSKINLLRSMHIAPNIEKDYIMISYGVLPIYITYNHILYAYPRQKELYTYEVWKQVMDLIDISHNLKEVMFENIVSLADDKNPWNINIILGNVIRSSLEHTGE